MDPLRPPTPLGANWTGEGTTFALYSEHATRVELCLFSHPDSSSESQRIDLAAGADGVWQGYVPDAGPGQAYGYRVHGPFAPRQGHRFNPAKLLLDPYARAISGTMKWSDVLSSYPLDRSDPDGDLIADPQDSATALPKSLVIDPAFDWEGDAAPRIPWDRTLVYECHVKGMTMLHPDVAEPLRGTYLGLAADPIIQHLKSLSVTTVELLPIHHIAAERRLAELGLTNYWGYNSIGYFAPDARFASGPAATGQQVIEFKSMVKRFHQAGIEVILDVVYNHTGEGSHLGPTLSFRGIDNATYYRAHPDTARLYADFTGCGNTVDVRHRRTRQLVLDSLRYWVSEMHVDGFRFDIAPVLGREDGGFSPQAAFFEEVRRDPVLSPVKLIAEPWDLGPDGYQLGRFPAGWSEWNGKYRDSVRQFWRGDSGQVDQLASRLSGSGDIYQTGGRTPQASVNFVTCHDGFTLQDLVSYEAKHNLTNGEHNRDGTDHNLSRNWGVEGPTDAVRTAHIRERMKRNFLATLAFSQGVPMLLHGDEMGRSQLGNNNAYCQDSPLSWVSWALSPEQRDLLQFTRDIFALRAATPALRRSAFLSSGGKPDSRELNWVGADGREMSAEARRDPANHVVGMLIRSESDEVILLLLNAGGRSRPLTLPAVGTAGAWRVLVDTHHPAPSVVGEAGVSLGARSLMLLHYQSV